MFKVAVQLLSWNGAEALPAVFDSLAHQTFLDFELYVLDNGSKDGSIEIIDEKIKTFPHPAHIFKSENNLGFSAGHNKLFAASAAPYVLCVNQDIELHPLYMEKLVTFLEAHPEAGAASGKLSRPGKNREVIDSAGLLLHWTGAVADIGAGAADHGQFDGVREVFGVSGALPLYRRSAVLAASPDGALFDASFFAYKEDVDLAWRLRLAGSKSYAVGEATALHARSMGAGRRRDPWRQRLSVKNHLLVLIKDLPGSQWFRVPVIVGYEALKAVYLLFSCPQALGGYLQAWQQLPNALKMRKVVQSRATAPVNQWFSHHG
jgi:GT2 family glycosyltransferase